MALNFPNSPVVGTLFNASNGTEYRYDGEKWTALGSYFAGPNPDNDYVNVTGDTMTGNLEIGTGIDLNTDGTAIFNGGIKPSSTSDLLDEYEEGTFTPYFQPSNLGSGFNGTYSQQVGTYTKIGNLVTCEIRLEASAASGGTGAARISGLPFTADGVGGATIGTLFGWSGASLVPDFARISNNNWIGLGVKSAVGANDVNISDVTSAANPSIWLTISYTTAA